MVLFIPTIVTYFANSKANHKKEIQVLNPEDQKLQHSNTISQQGRRKRGLRGFSPSPVFGWTVNPISTGGQIMPTTVLRAPLDFQTLRRPWSHQFNEAKIWEKNGTCDFWPVVAFYFSTFQKQFKYQSKFLHTALWIIYFVKSIFYQKKKYLFTFLFRYGKNFQKCLFYSIRKRHTLCCICLGRCCLGLETRVIIKISKNPCYPVNVD